MSMDDVDQDLTTVDLHFDYVQAPHIVGSQETRPRLSWKFRHAPHNFVQKGYEVEIYHELLTTDYLHLLYRTQVESQQSVLVPWPLPRPLESRERLSVRVRAWGDGGKASTSWSDFASVEAGLLERELWTCHRIASPWEYPPDKPQPEELFRKEFKTHETKHIARARLYITAQGVYEAEVNGKRVGDHFLAPGWTVYDQRLQYQTFNVKGLLARLEEVNCIGVRVAEGWFCGRLGFDGGNRNIYGNRPSLLAQLEIVYTDGSSDVFGTDSSWKVAKGPAVLAELYNGEKYDARLELANGSKAPLRNGGRWKSATVLDPLPETTKLIAGPLEPVRRIDTITPLKRLTTPSGKTILDFGQNLVGYTSIKYVRGDRGLKIRLSHAEVLEKGEIGSRPLRQADNVDEYILRGDARGEVWAPRFTFHGYRYVEVEGWPHDIDIMKCLEAVVCHTDMKRIGEFSCSDPLVNKLHENIVWSMKGNFLSIPTDCPQRDERLGWTGDLALFAPTASLLFSCTDMLRSWLEDVYVEQSKHAGIPPPVVPNVLQAHQMFGKVTPLAVWADVAVLAPWSLYQTTGDKEILKYQYQSMCDWLEAIPKNEKVNTHLWDKDQWQLGVSVQGIRYTIGQDVETDHGCQDWLDPSAPPDNPAAGKTDAVLVANAYLVHSLDLVARVASMVEKNEDATKYRDEAKAAKSEFIHEYLTSDGRLTTDSQTAYSLAICFDLLPSEKAKTEAGERLSQIVRENDFKIGTGFAGTPFVCEALALTGHSQTAYSMLLNRECPSWLYPVTMGSTTVWERWDSMLPDGSINPGEMTSFNHYALGAVARFMWERLAGLQCAEPGWSKTRIEPIVGGDFTQASASLDTPYGRAVSSWRLEDVQGEKEKILHIGVEVPPNASAEIVLPTKGTDRSATKTVGSGEWHFQIPADWYEGQWVVVEAV